jgi:hypothetical protein
LAFVSNHYNKRNLLKTKKKNPSQRGRDGKLLVEGNQQKNATVYTIALNLEFYLDLVTYLVKIMVEICMQQKIYIKCLVMIDF